MSTELNATRAVESIDTPVNPDQFTCSIIVARWNAHITGSLLRGAVDALRRAGVKEENIKVSHVPGTVELVYGAALARRCEKPDAVIVLGCVIRGDTPHFDYVCQSATQGVTLMNVDSREAPVIFGVLTVENETQALERAGGRLGNKGAECAQVAISMANLRQRLDSSVL